MPNNTTRVEITPIFQQLAAKLQEKTGYNSRLQGELLTIIDAIIADKDQRKAAKDLVKRATREHYNDIWNSISFFMGHFTDQFEGETIDYTVIGERDTREEGGPMGDPLFIG